MASHGVVLLLPVAPLFVLAFAFPFEVLVARHVSDGFLGRAFDALTDGSSFLTNRIGFATPRVLNSRTILIGLLHVTSSWSARSTGGAPPASREQHCCHGMQEL
jgi:hypothetical protein